MNQNGIKVQTFSQIKEQWKALENIYPELDSAPQSFYLALAHMLDLPNSKNVLEIGCGSCLLIPHTLDLKKTETKYLATDISEGMLRQGNKRLKENLQKYKSTLTYEEWLKSHNLTLKIANGEKDKFDSEEKFDRIICNMVVNLTENPLNMLKNLYEQATQGCLLGVSVWGQKQKDVVHTAFEQAVKQNGIPASNLRSNNHLYNKVGQIAQKAGWNTKLCWDQTSTFPFLSTKGIQKYAKFMVSELRDQDPKTQVYQSFMKKIQGILAKKMPLNFAGQVYVFKK